MHRLVKSRAKNKDKDLRLQWPTEEKGLDALDRELALLMSVKRWVAGATGGQTPRSIKEKEANLSFLSMFFETFIFLFTNHIIFLLSQSFYFSTFL